MALLFIAVAYQACEGKFGTIVTKRGGAAAKPAKQRQYMGIMGLFQALAKQQGGAPLFFYLYVMKMERLKKEDVMIRSSFIMLDKVGLKKEKAIWGHGIETWDDFLENKIKGISAERKNRHEQQIRLAKLNLDYENALHFREVLPPSEMWRIYPEFKDKAAYVDIETSGYYITVVGIYNGYEVKHFVRGFNMDRNAILNELYKHKLLLTFNGSSFDIPMLQRFLRHKINIAHIDLRHVCSRIGLKGGLKSIEKQLGIKRANEVCSMIGNDAVFCWEMFQHTGIKEYLDLLLQYNAEDVLNLKPLAEYAVEKLWNAIKLI